MGLEMLCSSLIALMFGLVICLGGYRLFLSLLPLWGFFFGFALGAASLDAFLGVGFLTTVTSLVVGFLVGALFGVLSYVFFTFSVAMAAGSLGYALGVGLMNLIGLDWGLLVWLVGAAAAVVAVLVTLLLNIQKYVVIAATAIQGAGIVVITLMFGHVDMTTAWLVENPIRLALQDSPLWAILFLLVVAAGIATQVMTTRNFVAEGYGSRLGS